MANTIVQNVHRNGHTYLLVDHGTSFTWAGAEAYAQSLGGHLVTINNASEQSFVYSTFAEIGFDLAGDSGLATWFWLGLNDVAAEGTFAWASGETASYTNWFSGQPNANNIPNQDYAAFFFFPTFDPAGQWFTIPDDDPANYALALIELPFLLGTEGKDKIKGGIGADLLTGLGGDDALYGFEGRDTLEGGKGDDVLIGGADEDTMTGGAGNDTYEIDDISGSDVDVFVELAGEGTDTIVLKDAFKFDMPDHFENFISQIENFSLITGNGAGNVMSGASGTDRFAGAGGGDTLYGNDGDDSLNGGSGKDRLYGGDGNDSLFGDVGTDVLFGGMGIDSYVTWGGADRIVFFNVAEIGKGASSQERERIARFDTGDYAIDLGEIDANGSAAGNGDFSFIGKQSFSGAAGELRYGVFDVAGTSGDHVIIEGDVNGDRKADFRIQLDNLLNGLDAFQLRAGDFVL